MSYLNILQQQQVYTEVRLEKKAITFCFNWLNKMKAVVRPNLTKSNLQNLLKAKIIG